MSNGYEITDQLIGEDQWGRKIISATLTFNGETICALVAEPRGDRVEHVARQVTVGTWSLGLGDGVPKTPRHGSMASGSGKTYAEEPTTTQVAKDALDDTLWSQGHGFGRWSEAGPIPDLGDAFLAGVKAGATKVGRKVRAGHLDGKPVKY